MGYYTNYDFSNNDEEIIEKICLVSGYGGSNGMFDSVKWYTWQEDMKIVSEMFPDHLINLSGVGEEKDDQWKAYFKNGRYQICHAEITFPPYDESKLK